MNYQDLIESSSIIAKRNLTDKVLAVTVIWENEISKLTVTYYVNGAVTDDEEEWCELTYAEITAEFPDVMIGDTRCISIDAKSEDMSALQGVVYIQNLNGKV